MKLPAKLKMWALVNKDGDMLQCSEVVKCGCKILRHGYEGQLKETNRQALERELGDVIHATHRMATAGDIDGDAICEHAASKQAHIEQYLHHQGKVTND